MVKHATTETTAIQVCAKTIFVSETPAVMMVSKMALNLMSIVVALHAMDAGLVKHVSMVAIVNPETVPESFVRNRRRLVMTAAKTAMKQTLIAAEVVRSVKSAKAAFEVFIVFPIIAEMVVVNLVVLTEFITEMSRIWIAAEAQER